MDDIRKELMEVWAKAQYEGGFPEYLLGYLGGDNRSLPEPLQEPVFRLAEAYADILEVFDQHDIIWEDVIYPEDDEE